MRTLVAMSGGVDSSAAALLAQRAGGEVCGVTLWMSGERPAGGAEICARLGIPFELWDVRAEFERGVVAPFADEYRAGRTPNPCVACNRTVKLGLLIDRARARGFDRVVSGHYARLERQPSGPVLRCGADRAKDQSYVLCMLTRAQLSMLALPLGGMEKSAVRALAREAGLAAADAAESQDICFIPDGDYCGFLERRGAPLTPGHFYLTDGTDLGPHRGFERYTPGQRRGLGVAWSCPLYVTDKRASDAAVILGTEEALLRTRLRAADCNWLAPLPPEGTLRCAARTRYHQRETPCTVTYAADGTADVRFDTPMRAPAPGQTAAFYDGDAVLGGGTIVESL